MPTPSTSAPLSAATDPLPTPVTTPGPDSVPLPPTPHPSPQPLTDPVPPDISDPPLPGGAPPAGDPGLT